MAYPLAKLRSLTPDDVKKLEEAGIDTVETFYEIAQRIDTRSELAEKTGIAGFTLEAWSADACNYLMMRAVMGE